ncbi:hypothetical protein MtrunA17_Chr8g0367541 [Medicago truncatula]|uniref:Uncharacterized protein n=1 Tax=Medicago truncatula TaxID=3880 RepID=A0A396GKC4_MEDTR|nr:hypothetical protein MtrunA17_Chr8g0367541 [Medicago truncatula]
MEQTQHHTLYQLFSLPFSPLFSFQTSYAMAMKPSCFPSPPHILSKKHPIQKLALSHFLSYHHHPTCSMMKKGSMT